MPKEFIMIAAAALSLIPGALIAYLGDGRAQYGMALLIVSMPFYCFFAVLLIFLALKIHSALNVGLVIGFLVPGFIFSFFLSLAIGYAGGGWLSAMALFCSLSSALLFFCFLKRPAEEKF
ncbi:hypothetical protein [Xylophilus sp. GOD-11R]|uniref:hypothetical protein n=1 Tax=Xylophilus sp. GOD-11R TaxID=3089814 RepID=UPI00298C6973|nr:hypothetical protein [Xylophilus sp. GOD-11R]WPB55380.1 hypothetical protein R9X41_14655 [Xylophilus sp. GOD-11R]